MLYKIIFICLIVYQPLSSFANLIILCDKTIVLFLLNSVLVFRPRVELFVDENSTIKTLSFDTDIV